MLSPVTTKLFFDYKCIQYFLIFDGHLFNFTRDNAAFNKGSFRNDVTQIWTIIGPSLTATLFSTRALILSSQNP